MANDKLGKIKSQFGKGALFGLSQDFQRVIEVDVDKIRPNAEQPRKTVNEDGIRELAASIERVGLLQPIVVKRESEDEYTLVAGQRRLLAHKHLGRERISVLVTNGNPDELALIENVQREDLNPLEEASAMARLMERYGYTQEELGAVIGKHQSTVSALLRLNDLPSRIREEYATSHTVPKSVLIEISRVRDEGEQQKLWEQVKGGATVRAARQRKKQGEGRTPQSPLASMVALGRSFVRKMERIPAEQVVDNREQYEELRLLRDRINEIVTLYERERAHLDHGEEVPSQAG